MSQTQHSTDHWAIPIGRLVGNTFEKSNEINPLHLSHEWKWTSSHRTCHLVLLTCLCPRTPDSSPSLCLSCRPLFLTLANLWPRRSNYDCRLQFHRDSQLLQNSGPLSYQNFWFQNAHSAVHKLRCMKRVAFFLFFFSNETWFISTLEFKTIIIVNLVIPTTFA